MRSSDIENTSSDLRRLADNRDYNLELASLDAGQQVRFLPKASRDTPLDRQKKGEQRATMAALHWLLLMDAEYAAQRERIQRFLLEADTRLIELHMEAERMASQNQHQISEMIAGASALNGETVFLSNDGTRAETLDGRILSDDERDQVHWRPDAASLENIRAAQRRQDKIVTYQAEIARVQNTVDTHQETLAHDADTPTTSDELANMDQQITGTMQKLEVMRAELTQDPDTARDLVADFNAKSPTLDFDGLITPPKSDPLALQH